MAGGRGGDRFPGALGNQNSTWAKRHPSLAVLLAEAVVIGLLIELTLVGRSEGVRYYIKLPRNFQPFFLPAVALLICGLFCLAWWARRRPLQAITLVVLLLIGLFFLATLIGL
jgi:hypothetical protein